MKKIKRLRRINWKAIIIAVLVTGLAWAAWSFYLEARTNQAHLLKNLQSKQVELNTKLKELDQSQGTTQQLKQQKQQLEQQKEDLQKQLDAKRAAQAADKAYAASLPAPALKVAPAAPRTVVSSCNDPKSCIYMHESGGNPGAVNSIGCRGLGQACPGSKLPCGDDYACQDAWFTSYATTKYGSWGAAWAFWQAHSWW